MRFSFNSSFFSNCLRLLLFFFLCCKAPSTPIIPSEAVARDQRKERRERRLIFWYSFFYKVKSDPSLSPSLISVSAETPSRAHRFLQRAASRSPRYGSPGQSRGRKTKEQYKRKRDAILRG